MKKVLICLIMSFSFFSTALNAQVCKDGEDAIVAMERHAHQHALQRSSNTGLDYDLKYHRCEWSIDPNIYAIQGKITSYFVTKNSGFSQINFDLSNVLVVDSVIYHGASIGFNQSGVDELHIPLSLPLGSNILDSVSVIYHGVPSSSGFGSFNQDQHNGVPVIWSLSEPFGARDWWPCKQSLEDKIDSIDIIVTTPQAYRAASNGLLVEEYPVGNEKVYHWQSHYSIPAYLMAVAVTNYAVYSDFVPLGNGDTLEVLNYVYPEDLSTAMANTPDIINTIQLYDSLNILYPFSAEKYGHAQFNWGGGMEHQTMTFIVAFYHDLMAHECAHQWFGDHVTCGSWEDIWLNEGFATYFEGLTEERYFPLVWDNWKSSKIANITAIPDGSVKCTDTTDVGRIFNGRLTYNKGAYLLHMLRWKLGDSLFFQGLRNYQNDPLLSYAYAKTPDLINHMQNVSGQSLTTFFNQWYYQQGNPSYQIQWAQHGTDLIVQINQTQSDPSVTYFEMPVPIHFLGVGLDTILRFENTFNGQIFHAVISNAITAVTFDPELWLLASNNTVTANPLLALESPDQSVSFVCYPNPVSDHVVVSFKSNVGGADVFELTDLLGNTLEEFQIKTNSTQLDISLKNYPSGTYLIRSKNRNINAVQRIVKI